MMRILLFSTILLACSSWLHAQKTIAVQSNGTASFHTDWPSAWAATLDGDTIYLPGGTFTTGNITVDRKVTIIGVGHDATQTHDGLFSHLNGNIHLVEGSDYSSLHGLQFTNLYFHSTSHINQAVNNITVSRCRISSQVQMAYTGQSLVEHILFEENVFSGRIIGYNARHIQFFKNIMDERVSNFNGTVVFSNNIFTYFYNSNSIYAPIQSSMNVLFQNNIFRTNNYPFNPVYCENNLMKNNIFQGNFTPNPSTDLNTWQNNYYNQPLSEVFVNYTTGAFYPANDYHLLPSSVGVGNGSDGFDIGIYGTAIPFKEGAVPFNPRITFEQVSGETNASGNIEIQINVSAQDR